MDPRLRELGRELARKQDAEPCRVDLSAQRSRFLDHARGQPFARAQNRALRPARAPMRWLAAAALAAALCAWGLFPLRETAPEPGAALAFEVGGAPGRVGTWLAAPAGQPLPLRFADGSALVMAVGSRARVIESNARGAYVVLEQGSISMHVVHRPGTDFRIKAGPFEVRVVGTRFDVSWDSEREQLRLALHEGAVKILGPSLAEGRMVKAGERVEFPAAASHGPREQDASAGLAHASGAPLSDRQVLEPVVRAAAPRRQVAGSRGAGGRAEQTASTHAGIAREGPVQLARRADAARFSGQPEQAALALLDLRARFADTRPARDSAFLLGRLYFDQLAAPEEAARWFEISLREQPQGMFAREAAGRLLESLLRLADTRRAREVAEHYLRRHPQGPHVALAREVLGSPAAAP